MKYALCFLAGALTIALAVLLAAGLPAGMFLTGVVMALIGMFCGSRIAGFARIGRFLLAVEKALESSRGDIPIHRGKDQLTKANVVPLPKSKPMLDTVQQDVVSALVNLGVSMTQAEKVVLEAASQSRRQGFDALLRACLPRPNFKRPHPIPETEARFAQSV